MTTQNETKRMKDAFRRARIDIASLAERFKCELEKYKNDDRVTWASVNALEYVQEQLVETIAMFSLEELHT